VGVARDESSAASQNITFHGHYLNDLEEHSGSVADGLGEDLQQRALVVPVDQDAQLLGQLVLLLVHLVRAHAGLGALVVVVALPMKPMEALRCKQYCNACPLLTQLRTCPGRNSKPPQAEAERIISRVWKMLLEKYAMCCTPSPYTYANIDNTGD
jgi:hypothetical protein